MVMDRMIEDLLIQQSVLFLHHIQVTLQLQCLSHDELLELGAQCFHLALLVFRFSVFDIRILFLNICIRNNAVDLPFITEIKCNQENSKQRLLLKLVKLCVI